MINPDDVVADFGADSLRLYEMFMGPLRDTKVRQEAGKLPYQRPAAVPAASCLAGGHTLWERACVDVPAGTRTSGVAAFSL